MDNSELSGKKQLIPIYSEEDFKKAIENISFNHSSRACNNNRLFGDGIGLKIENADYYRHSLKRSRLLKSYLLKTSLVRTAFTGSSFIDTDFIDCNFEFTNFQSCIIDSCRFIDNNVMSGCNFTGSNISRTIFDKDIFSGCNFYNSTLKKCKFNNSEFTSSSFESTKFIDCEFTNFEMSNLNIEFSQFLNVVLEDVVISAYQCPYILGGLSTIVQNNYKVIFALENNRLSLEKYMKLLPNFKIYFTYLNEYYPLVNIFMAEGDRNSAHTHLMTGIEQACLLLDCRMIEHYCIQGKYYNLFSIDDCKSISSKIDLISNESKESETYKDLLQFSSKMRSLLLMDEGGKSKLEFIIKTNLSEENIIESSKLIQKIDNISKININHDDMYFVEIRHNSPIEIFFTCIGHISSLITITSHLYHLLLPNLKNDKKDVAKLITNLINCKRSITNEVKDILDSMIPNNETKDLQDLQIELCGHKITGVVDEAIDNAILSFIHQR